VYRREEPTWLPGHTYQLPSMEASDDREEKQATGGRRIGMRLQSLRNTL